MLPDALPQLLDTLLRLPCIEAAQLRELIQRLPDPQAAAQEMVRHAQYSTTASIYQHVATEDMFAAAQAVQDWLEKALGS